MNITILANKDVASCLALNYLVEGLQPHRLSIFLSSRVGSKPLPPALQQLKFVEQDLFNQLLFPAQAVMDSAAGELSGFERLKDCVGQRLEVLNEINSEAGLAELAATEPDLVLSIRYGVILQDAALTVPSHGVLNLHSGRLPEYKGVMATFWALLNGDTEIGTTLHFIDDASIDTGRIVGRTTLPVDPQRSYLWHVLSLYQDGCQQMIQAAQTLAQQQELPASPQTGAGNYFSFPSERDLALFNDQGWRLWDPQDALELAKRFLGTP